MEINTPNPPKPSLVRRSFRWLFVVGGVVALLVTGYEIVMRFAFHITHEIGSHTEYVVFTLIRIMAVVFVLVLGCSLFRQVACGMAWPNRFWNSRLAWRNARRSILVAACSATLVATFYAEENWRGKCAWENCKRDLEAKGEVLDWSAYIPAPIPDDQNIIKAPKMTEWFVRPKPGAAYTNDLGAKFGYGLRSDYSKSPILVAQVSVGPVNSMTGSDGRVVVRQDAPDAKERFGKIVQDAVGPRVKSPWGPTFVQRQPSSIKPIPVWLETDKPLSLGDLSQLFSTNLVSPNVGHLRVENDTAPNSYRILLVSSSLSSAGHYLATSDAATPELDLIREALKRPQIRMDGDFQRPFEMPTVNFVFMRNLAQTVASRAQCYLLLGKPEQAVRELSLIAESRRFLAAKPTTLVAAMIDVAICGLYVQTIADGFRLEAWREPELVALQQQLSQINLLPAVVNAFRGERAAVCHTFQTISAKEMAKTFYPGDSHGSLWGRLNNPVYLLLKFAPRGWIYQNLVTIATVEQATSAEIIDPASQLVRSDKAAEGQRDFGKTFAHGSPFNILANIAVPNFSRATQTLALNQTRMNQAVIVCGLERYRRAHGDYPETLAALVPQFVEKLPHDLIGGQSLKYRRTDDGTFLLYSIGWNETDNGGQTAFRKDGAIDLDSPDWAWQPSAP